MKENGESTARRAVAVTKKFKWVLLGGGTVLLLAFVLWQWVLPRVVSLPKKELAALYPARLFFDRDGVNVHCERGGDYRWRIPIALHELPPHVPELYLALEDRNFYDHDGFDRSAALRASWQFLRYGRIVSGASTATMQLMNVASPRKRSLYGKILRIFQARGWELRYSKEEILTDLLNHLPFGGKIYGIESASRYYFGHSARTLTREETILLIGLPQAPNRFRPDRHPEALLRRRELVLRTLVRNGAVLAEDAEAMRTTLPHFGDFSLPRFLRADDPQFFRYVDRFSATEERTTLDSGMQRLGRRVLRQFQGEAPGVRDGALVIVENKTGSLRAMIGTLDFRSPFEGQINAALTPRSPGSLLKPFLFGAAIEGGMLVADTRLDDAPLALADYHPGNFDGTFRGPIRAAEALADSRNTPAIRLLRGLGVRTFIDTLKEFYLCSYRLENAGLSLALGGVEFSLLELTYAYAAIGNGGNYPVRRVRETEKPRFDKNIWSAGTCQMLSEMLRLRPLPHAGSLPVAWKSGTSNGNRDAWCVAYTPEWTVGIWFGNKDGKPSPHLVGGRIAVPAAGVIVRSLYDRVPPPEWPDDALEIATLCRKSGRQAGMFCAAKFPGRSVSGIPPAPCGVCRRAEGTSEEASVILSPLSGKYLAQSGEEATFRLRTGAEEAHWYCGRRYLGVLPAGRALTLPRGKHRLTAWIGEGRSPSHVDVTVE